MSASQPNADKEPTSYQPFFIECEDAGGGDGRSPPRGPIHKSALKNGQIKDQILIAMTSTPRDCTLVGAM